MGDAVLSSVNRHFEDHEGIASYKSLSIAFGWSLEESQRNLGKYLELHPQLHPVYCVSGFHTDPEGKWEYVVRLTKSVDDNADKDLTNSTRHIYSLHRSETTNPMALACFDKLLDQDPTAHPVLVSFQWQPCKPVASGAKPQKAVAEPSPVKQKPSTSSSTVTATKSVASSSRNAAPASKRRPTKRQPKSNVQSNLKFVVKDSEPHKAPAEPEPEPIPDPFADSGEDEVYDDESEDLHTKRRRIVFSSDEEGAERAVKTGPESDRATLKNENENLPASTSRASKKHNKSPQNLKGTKTKVDEAQIGRKRGGWNGKEGNSGEGEELFKLSPAKGVRPDHPSAADPSRDSCRRQVTKTYLDDDGFLVTEKVWEDVKINEGDAEQAEPLVPSTSKPKASPSPKKPGGPKKTKQARLTSFFKK